MVYKRTFKKPINTREKLELVSTRGRNGRLEVISSGNTECRQWSGDWTLMNKSCATLSKSLLKC